MTNINWTRFIIGGLIATVILFVTDGLLHEMLLKPDWLAVYANLGAPVPEPHGASMVYFFIFELGRGMLAMLLYVLMRAYTGAGPKTAVLAGLAVWAAFSLAGPAQFIPLGFYSVALWVKVAAFQLVTSVVGTLAGAAIYKDPGTPAASAA